MTVLAPADAAALTARADALCGQALGDLAASLGVALDGSGARTKGTQGALLERLLGAGGGSRAVHDFPALGVELKTIPVDEAGRPRESAFVCTFPLASADRAAWATSWVRAKLGCVLWVPIITPPRASMAARRVGRSVLWRPTAAQEAVLAADFEEIVGLVGSGQIEALTARTGRFLQVRPKAAHGRVRTRAYGPDDELIEALPRGFYLRRRFTGAILIDPASLPE